MRTSHRLLTVTAPSHLAKTAKVTVQVAEVQRLAS
jgi:hypothetical protein